ncbi:MAG: hypothetical protein HY863_06950 [Chloroflexi bacterium]|nr:hypothetical protein [Chloroflexota bacterium]
MNAILWFVYCIYIYYDMEIVNHNGASAYIAAIFLFVMATSMFISGVVLGRQPKRVFYPTLVLIVLNTIFSLMNLSDLLYLVAFVVDAVIISLLLSLRKEYLSIP